MVFKVHIRPKLGCSSTLGGGGTEKDRGLYPHLKFGISCHSEYFHNINTAHQNQLQVCYPCITTLKCLNSYVQYNMQRYFPPRRKNHLDTDQTYFSRVLTTKHVWLLGKLLRGILSESTLCKNTVCYTGHEEQDTCFNFSVIL